MWHKTTRGCASFFLPLGPWYCQVYQIREELWRWEVLHWSDQTGRFALKQLGTQPTLSQAFAAAEGYVAASRKATPS